MPFDDLDLEFEDEDESKKKKSDAVHVDVDLEFQSHQAEKAKVEARPIIKQSGTSPSIKRPEAIARTGEVKKLDDARMSIQKRPVSVTPVSSAPRAVGTSALKEDSQFEFDSEEVVRLREHARKVEFDAEVRVAVAEHKLELMSELLGDMKVMEHQIGQLLARINAKHPDMKQEALMIKKILADFTAKKRK